jgi:hypothetical protein
VVTSRRDWPVVVRAQAGPARLGSPVVEAASLRGRIKGQGSGAGGRRYDGGPAPWVGWTGPPSRPSRERGPRRTDWVQVRRAGRSTGRGERCRASPPVSVGCRADGTGISRVSYLNPVDRSAGRVPVAVIYRAFIRVFGSSRFGTRVAVLAEPVLDTPCGRSDGAGTLGPSVRAHSPALPDLIGGLQVI